MITTQRLPPIAPPVITDPFAGKIILQIYRDAYRGDKTTKLQRDLDTAKQEGFDDICFHGFPREMLNNWARLAGYAVQRRITALASWGLDGTRDNDGTVLTSREKGEAMGIVLAQKSCAAGLLDAEGLWDRGGTDPQGPTETGALELGIALRERAPEALLGDQPWPWIDWHGDVRRSARPFGQGGTFAGFPVDEFAFITNWGRFRQDYWLNWAEANAYWTVTDTMEKQWQPVQSSLQALGLARPLRVTLQGYGHEERPWHFAHALLRWMVRDQQPVVLWCAPFPNAFTLRVIAAVRRLVALGFAGPGIDPRQAVLAFQRDYNRTSSGVKRIDEDGWLGVETIKVLVG